MQAARQHERFEMLSFLQHYRCDRQLKREVMAHFEVVWDSRTACWT